MRVGLLGLMTLVLAASLPGLDVSCEAELRYLPSQPPSPFPSPRPPTCEGADDLVKAAANNCVAKMKAFLRNGVSPEWQAEDGQTALVAAARAGRVEAARVLLEAGANPTVVFRLRSALCWGAGSTEVTRLFLKRGLLAKLEVSCPYLAIYSEWGKADVVRELIASGIDLEKGYSGRTPLTEANTYRNYPVIQALLEAGANPDATIWANIGSPVPVLHHADPVVTCLLLKHDADVNGRNYRGETPLMSAAHVGLNENVRLLLEGGADPDLQDSSGRTALMHALTGALQLQHSFVSRSSKDAVALALLYAGANFRLKDKGGRDALSYAEENGHESVAAMLREQLK